MNKVAPRTSDMTLLVPAFRERAEAALRALKDQGFAPVVHETWRSQARALALVAAGKSKARGGASLHCFGLAIDVICGVHGWDCRRHHCKFFETWGHCAEDVDLTWGGRWTTIVDLPHVQLPPLHLQNRFRGTPAGQLDALARAYLAGHLR